MTYPIKTIMFAMLACASSSNSIYAVANHSCPQCNKLQHEKNSDAYDKHMPQSTKPITAHLPKNFGKTHFIVGAQTAQVQKEFNQQPDVLDSSNYNPELSTSTIAHAYFSPDDGIEQLLIDLIKQEQKSIQIAVFLITNGAIAEELANAKKRGVTVELVTDQTCLHDKFNKINVLHGENIPIYIYQPSEKPTIFSNCMHHKFIIFGQNNGNQPLLWLGSSNLTKSATRYNQEGCVLLDLPHLITKFSDHFDQLKKRCIDYAPSTSAISHKTADHPPKKNKRKRNI